MGTNSNSSTPVSQRPSVGTPMSGSEDKGAQQSYWERLPIEILEDIFLMCMPLGKICPPRDTDAPILLTRICRAWYKIATETSKMWTTIVVTTPNDTDIIPPWLLWAGTRYITLCIARSKHAPLELYIRAEFIPLSFVYMQVAKSRLERLFLIYPFAPLDPFPSFFPCSSWDVPNMTTLEVHARRTISVSDQLVLNKLLVQPLRKFVCVTPSRGDTRICDMVYFPETSLLQVLVLHEIMPISACFFILQTTPSLRQCSLTVGIFDHDEPIFDGLDRFHPPTRPFVHPTLQYLAITHLGSDISTFFNCVALPSLHFLVLDFQQSTLMTEPFWPHDHFIVFLQRSGCKLRSFHVYGQPINPVQLLEILWLPQVTDSLEYLGIRNCASGEEEVMNDSVLEELTLPLFTLQEINSILDSDSSISHPPPALLCPNIERLMLFVPLESVTLSKLITMFDSRLSWNTSSAFRQHKFLRRVDMEAYEQLNAEVGSLREKGLVFTLGGGGGGGSVPDSVPLVVEQQELLRRYMLEGLDDEYYDSRIRTWFRYTMV